jgi:hypothetical protein
VKKKEKTEEKRKEKEEGKGRRGRIVREGGREEKKMIRDTWRLVSGWGKSEIHTS